MKSTLYYLFFVFLSVLSCKEGKDTPKSTDITKDNTTESITKEPEINIDGLLYEANWNGVISEGDYDEVVGTYVENRFNTKKTALSTDGLSEYVKVENHEKINPKKEITISLWYKPISFKGSGNDYLIFKPFNENKTPFIQYALGLTGNEHPSMKVKGSFSFGLSIDGKYHLIRSKTDIWAPDEWYNITGVYDGKYMKLYVNGEVVNNRTIEGTLDIYNTDLFIGKHQNNKFYTPGTYDNFKIYERALSKEEIELLAS